MKKTYKDYLKNDRKLDMLGGALTMGISLICLGVFSAFHFYVLLGLGLFFGFSSLAFLINMRTTEIKLRILDLKHE